MLTKSRVAADSLHFVCYLFNYLDRVNVGFAKLEMLDALGLSETVYGLGAGIFFIGYVLCGVPSNLMLHKVGARRWIALLMLVWGALSACLMFVSTPQSFYTLRFSPAWPRPASSPASCCISPAGSPLTSAAR